ncbi:hypothetical protein NP233_g3644 [Leucocoprinus birnbaumii]|uniref:NADH-cytochrome b5 reductase n=1 Tax=Leucocoprinus birnbaumii TaxID=56174 RepID=A0AAD5YTQ0_9AGAR|nr:hypothetical protein NP233_g3644 [Leucocoprinus birnbaumii]
MSLLRTALASSPRAIVCSSYLPGVCLSHFHRAAVSRPPQHPRSPPGSPAILIGAGLGGAGLYYYLEQQSKPAPKPKPTRSALDPENFKDFKLKKIKGYNDNTSEFIFELPPDEASLLSVASFVYLKASDPEALKGPNGKPVVRPYTPISDSEQLGEITFLIKKYETGNMSKYIHSLKEGDTIAIKGPLAKFPYKENEFDHIALIGGGSGITPLYQILTHALDSPNNKTKFTLIFSNVAEKDILLREELEALKKKHADKLDLVYYLDKPSENWKGGTGYITADVIKKYVPSPELKEKLKVFICGPPPQVASIAGKKDGFKQGELGGIMKELGYNGDQVYKF